MGMGSQEEVASTKDQERCALALWVHPDLFRLMLTEREMITPHLDLNRIPQRRKANKLNRGAHQKPHLHEPGTALGGDADLDHARLRAGRQLRKRLAVAGHASLDFLAGGEGLDHDRLSQARADP